MEEDVGTVLQLNKDYGIGIDCHSKFLQISVIVQQNGNHVEFQREFETDATSIDCARDWCVKIIREQSNP